MNELTSVLNFRCTSEMSEDIVLMDNALHVHAVTAQFRTESYHTRLI